MTKQRIAIIGAGITGLSCARALAAAGLSPILFDKGRGVGGRLATRRAEGGLQFDHGASQISATGAPFAALLQQAEAAGALSRWTPEGGAPSFGGPPSFVGLPGMSGLARHLAQGLDIRTGVTAQAVEQDGAGWRIRMGEGTESFDRVILALPAPQITRLLGEGSPLCGALSGVEMTPCLTLMAAFPAQGAALDQTAASALASFGRVTLENAKPGRSFDRQLWVAHADPGFSARYLECELSEIAAVMLPLLCTHLGRAPADALHAVAHRWRYAQVAKPLGRPFLSDGSGTLLLGGDWCLGNSAEAGWTSGQAIAAEILAR